MESNYQVTTQMRNKFAMHMFHVKLPMDFVDKINAYIDNTLIPLDDNYGKVKGNAELEHSYSKGLVGQIRQNEKSAQLDCKVLDDTEDAKLLKSTLDATSQEYLRQIGHGDSVPDVFEAWTVHSFAGDYNPLHDHGVLTPGGLSMILYMKVPECISKLPDPDDKDGKIWFNDHSGDIDGFTYFIWDMRNQDMLRKNLRYLSLFLGKAVSKIILAFLMLPLMLGIVISLPLDGIRLKTVIRESDTMKPLQKNSGILYLVKLILRNT